MSVDKWFYHEGICDGLCPGDCDLCDIPKNPPEEIDDEEQDDEERQEAQEIINARRGEE